MRRTAVASVLALIVGLLGSAQAAPAGLNAAGPGPGGVTSDNVEFIRNLLISQDGVGGRLIGKYFYANDQNKVMIFDTSTPEDPQLTGQVLMPQEWLFSREDLDGNNKLIVVPNQVSGVTDGSPPTADCEAATCAANALYIIDVEDKTNPVILSKLNGGGSHTSSCILNCKFVYNSNGAIIDLRNPAEPKMTDFKWGDGKPAQNGHDVEEIAPGLVLTASKPIMLLDARKNPLKPKLLATGDTTQHPGTTLHTGRWANRGKDKFLLVGSEQNFVARCNQNVGSFSTWDASKWKKKKTFTMIDVYQPVNGTFVDGNAPVGYGGGCSSHWLEPSPKFRNGGIVAGAFFENGVKFLKIDRKGMIEEVDWFMPWVGSTGAAYWITDEILYTLDYNRGIDVIRYTGKHK